MKALAIDSASRCITICAKNNDAFVKISADAGTRQSEIIVPLIETACSKLNIMPLEFDYTALCTGPGSFTSLRLAFASLKALQLTSGCPIYGLDTLKAHASPYTAWHGAVIPVLDARKEKFYAAIYRSGQEIVPSMDEQISAIISLCDPEERVLAVGPDAELFADSVRSLFPTRQICTMKNAFSDICAVLLEFGETSLRSGDKGIEEYQGPTYLRSEV